MAQIGDLSQDFSIFENRALPQNLSQKMVKVTSNLIFATNVMENINKVKLQLLNEHAKT